MKPPCFEKKDASTKKKLGFTLIEIVVVAGIIGVLSVIGVSSYNNFNEKREVRRAANDLKAHIRLAANKAKNSEKNCDSEDANHCAGVDGTCATDDDRFLVGWYVDFTTGEPLSMSIYGACQTEAEADETFFGQDSFAEGFDDINLAHNGVGIDKVLFYPPGSPLGTGTDLTEDLEITISRSDDEFRLFIDPSGNVSDFVGPSPSPGPCLGCMEGETCYSGTSSSRCGTGGGDCVNCGPAPCVDGSCGPPPPPPPAP